nr:hypothetical protein [Ruminococcus sp. 1001713B170207_170306_F5]
MKKKYLAAILGVMMAATSVTACEAATTEKTTSTAESSENKDAEDTTADSTKSTDSDNSDSNEDANADADKESFDKGDSDEEDVTYGEVKSVETGKITIAVGTMKEMGGNGGTPGGEQGEAPEKPDGDNGNGESPEKPANDSIAPEKPDGDNGNGQAQGSTQGGASDGNNSQSETIELSGIQEGDIVAITTDDDGNALTIKVQSTDMGGGQGAPGGAPGGQSQGVDGYDAVNTYDSDTEVSDTSLESTGTDENAALVSSGANVTFNNVDITRNSSDSTGGDNSSFYGVGAALLATEGNAYVKGGTVNTDAAGGAGLFAYGDGTVYAADTTIKTTQDTSGGIHAAGGGKLYAWELNVETNGESAAAIRSDRGGGTMVVDGGTYTSNGEGSPAVYCTADIAVKDATLTANGSEAVCIEGLNSLHLFDCDLTGNMSDLSQNDSTWTVILYQSMSGDSEVGNSTFQMDGGTLTSQNGGVFYTTNTESDITLNTVDITYNNDNEYFLRCTGNNNERGWGESGANGADCDFTAISQDMEGDVIWDTISQLDFYMTDGSNLTGVIIDDESFAGNGGDGYCNVYVSDDSTWTVTGNSTVSTLSNAGTIVDDSGKTVTIKGTDGTVYAEGDSDYTITVDKYEETADTSDSETIASWSDYEVEKPDTL